jgi:hypothetical protein
MAQDSSAISVRRVWMKYLLWALMGCATVLISIYIELPLLRLRGEQAFLRSVPLLIVPHAIGGTIALVCGPLQFSSRLRRSYPRIHRTIGRVYIYSVFIAAPVAVLMAVSHHDFKFFSFAITTAIQCAAWVGTTGVAFVAACRRQIQRHRVWMVRSYAVTFTFVFLRLLRFIPAWNHMSRARNNAALILVTLLAVLIPEIASFGRSLGAGAFHRPATD